MHPYLLQEIARRRVEDLRRAARQYRLVRSRSHRPVKVPLMRIRFPQAEPSHLQGRLRSPAATGRLALGRGLPERRDQPLTEPDRHEYP
jgi:hypothetical protein